MKSVHVIEYTPQALADLGDGVQRFAHAENLPGHAAAIAARTGSQVQA
jgi:histidinol dehydrogenase